MTDDVMADLKAKMNIAPGGEDDTKIWLRDLADEIENEAERLRNTGNPFNAYVKFILALSADQADIITDALRTAVAVDDILVDAKQADYQPPSFLDTATVVFDALWDYARGVRLRIERLMAW